MAEVIVRFDLKFSNRAVRLAMMGAMLLAAAPELASESVSLTTYYPAPSGVYTQIIGTSNSYMARDAGVLDVGTNAAQVGSTKMVVLGGAVGIGTTNPTVVAGSAFTIDTAGTGGSGTAFDINQSAQPRFAINPQANGSWQMFDGGGNAWHQGLQGYEGNIGVQTTPGVTFDVIQGGDIRVGQANLSSGGDYMHLANNEYYNGGSWLGTGVPGVLLQFSGTQINFYTHNGFGTHAQTAALTAGGDFYDVGSLQGQVNCSPVASFAPNTFAGCGGYVTSASGVYAREVSATLFMGGGSGGYDDTALSVDALCCPCPSYGCNL